MPYVRRRFLLRIARQRMCSKPAPRSTPFSNAAWTSSPGPPRWALAVVLPFLALAIKREDRGPILYRQTRREKWTAVRNPQAANHERGKPG